jgi:hypothetical protein
MEYLSLYDYLRKPAGEKLGLEVATEARKQGIQTQTREISNPKYTGIVYLYPKDFLESYFKPTEDVLPKEHDWTGNIVDDDLPF